MASLLAGTLGVAAADSGPLADAGLDQEVTVDTTVQLDGTGSSHPDGTIDSYEWSIETPNGGQITPDCADCARTHFTPDDPGRYDVTLTVTDGEGRSDSDTLYVYVEGAGPSVELDGPTDPPADEPTPYEATAETTNAELEEITWRVDDATVAEGSLSGAADTDERPLTFSDPGTHRIEVVVRDSSGRTARDTLLVEPQAFDSDDDSDTGGSVDAGSDSQDGFETGNSECDLAGGPATAGYTCVGDPTDGDTGSVTSGYNSACDDNDCASGPGSGNDDKGDDPEEGDGDNGANDSGNDFPDEGGENGSSDGGGGSGFSSDGSGYRGNDSGYIQP
ncbi:PKD domain-containing protein [Natronomonas marina]|uniref:PKD domain-containing protein n=1 Tax=Natronomonas marina TaxID=2961939 RepID=UPI0020C9C7EC|nr:PKD domain-containing protein [Natronomonas marina]